MQLIVTRGSHSYGYAQIATPEAFGSPFGGADYTCLLWDSLGGWTPTARDALAASLIASGCLSLVCGGTECEVWHDAADEAYGALCLAEPAAEERLLMTTWHADEPPEEVAFYLALLAEVEDRPIGHHLVLHLGVDDSIGAELVKHVKAHVLDPEWAGLTIGPA